MIKYLIPLICLTVSCYAQTTNKYYSQINDTVNVKNIVTKEFKIFDIKALNKLTKQQEVATKGYIDTYREDSTLLSRFIKEFNYYQLTEYDKNNQAVQETILTTYNNRIEVRKKMDEYFTYYELYYANGNICKKCIGSWLGFVIGMSYEYDESGKLIKEKNWDDGYELSFDDMLEFCKKNKMDLLTKTHFRHSISKVETDGRKYWVISYCNDETRKIEAYKIDAKTGEIAKNIIEEYPQFKHFSPDE